MNSFLRKLFKVDELVAEEKEFYSKKVKEMEERQLENDRMLEQRVKDEKERYLKGLDEVNQQRHELNLRENGLSDLECSLREKQKKIDSTLSKVTKDKLEYETKLDSVKYKEKILDKELLYAEYLDESGFYTDLNQLVFSYGNTQQYKAAIQRNLDEQKDMISSEKVCIWGTKWTVEGSAAKGEKMMKDTSKMVIRCLNSECNAIIGNIGRSTFDKVEAKIKKSFTQIEKLQKSHNMSISKNFLELKLEQAKLVFEQHLKNIEEKELEAKRRAELSEQEKLEREIQKEKEKILKDKQQFLKEMERLQKQRKKEELLESRNQELLNRILELESKINKLDEEAESLDTKGSAKCRAGWVYVISQPGSGEVKIGTTRRLDPHERIKELSSASVPFRFNTHAVIFAEDAFELERKIHEHFTNKRVNKVNKHKEFFNVSLEEIDSYIRTNIDSHIEFVYDPENEEYVLSQQTNTKEGK